MSYTTFSNAIHTRLAPLVGASIKELSQSEIQTPNGYPYISILEDDTMDDEQVFDSVSNLANYRFKVRLVHSSKDLAATNQNMRALADTVLAKIREDLTFGCKVAKVGISVKWGYLNEEQTRVCDIGLTFYALVDIW